MKEIKLFGLQRTGTNFFRVAMESNFDVTVLMNDRGWKHGHLSIADIDIPIVVLVKNPYSWLSSMYRYMSSHGAQKNLRPDSFSDFIRSEFTMNCDISIGSPPNEQKKVSFQILSKNPVVHWNSFYWHWRSVGGVDVRQLKYEDLLDDPKNHLSAIANRCGLSSKGNFGIPDRETRPSQDGWKHKLGDKFTKKNYYLKDEFMSEFEESDKQFVEQELNGSLMEEYGYGQ
jgi:hypothetical protein